RDARGEAPVPPPDRRLLPRLALDGTPARMVGQGRAQPDLDRYRTVYNTDWYWIPVGMRGRDGGGPMAGDAEHEGEAMMRHEALSWLASAMRFERFMAALRTPDPVGVDETAQLHLVARHHRRGDEDRAA